MIWGMRPSTLGRTSSHQALLRPHISRLSAVPPSSIPQTRSLGENYFAVDDRPIILFDGVCNLCNGGVNTALKFDKKGALRFAALQSDAGKTLLQRSGRNPDDISSIVLVEESGSFIKSDAILRIAKYLQIPFPVLAQFALPLPRFVRDGVYDQIAGSRYDVFGKSTVCRMKDDDRLDRFVE
jgi:predicted DCC family thiol-disulfide oxidoreductase YuxK